MAKKQGISYAPNSSLIQGAATAYRNYDNAPGMYSGLDKVIKTGTEIGLKAMADKKTADDKAVVDAENALTAEKKKKKDQDNAWYTAAGATYEAAGSFMKPNGPELTDTIALLDTLQPDFTKAMESGTAAEKAAVMQRYQAIKTNVDLHKKLRVDITDGLIGASDANFNRGTLVGDDGRFGDFLTGLIKEDYKITYETDGDGVKQKMYTVGDTSYTLEEINKKTVRKDKTHGVKYYAAMDRLAEKGVEFDEDQVTGAVIESMPSIDSNNSFNEMREFMRGKNFRGKNIAEIMSTKKNRKSIENTIDMQLFDSGSGEGGIEGDGIIQDSEFENFLSATVDPYHPIWNQDGKVDKQGWEESSRAIAQELLVNGIRNKNALNNPEDPTWKKEGYANKGAYDNANKGNFEVDEDTETETITDPNDPNYVNPGPVSSTVFDLIDVKKDDAAAEALNKKLNLVISGQDSRKSKVAFAPYSSDYSLDRKVFGVGTGFLQGDAIGNDIMMYNPKTGDVYRDADDKIIRFPTGNDAFAEQKKGEENPTALRIIEELKRLGIDTSMLQGSKAKVDEEKI